MANFALNYSFSRNLNIPLDEDAVKATLAEVTEYVATKGKCYAGQLFSVTADTGNNGLYFTLSTGAEGSVVRLATQDKLNEKVNVKYEKAGNYDVLANSLLNGQYDVVFLNSAYYEMALEDVAGFTKEETRILEEIQVVTELENKSQTIDVTKDSFNV